MRASFPDCLRSGLAIGLLAGSLSACGPEENQGASHESRLATRASRLSAPSRTTKTRNQAPVIQSVGLEPDNPLPGDRLQAIVTAEDHEGDSIRLRYHWSIDGVEISNPAPELLLRNVTKGAEVAVRVMVRDSHSEGESVETSTVVGNRAPQIRSVNIAPSGRASRAQDLTAVPNAFDPDGDTIEFEYEWAINGRTTSNRNATLSRAEIRRGDEIVVSVWGWDGDERSEPFRSDAVQVLNAPPRIVSRPTAFDGRRFDYAVEVDDPDGDRGFHYSLVEAPAGMTIAFSSGEVKWEPSVYSTGAHRVEIRVSDHNGGMDSQSFVLSLGSVSGAAPASPSL